MAVEARVDSAALRSFVVRVRSVDGRTLGSGVLVAPGWALTCAHVVHCVDDVLVQGAGLPDPIPGGPPGETARVVLRSNPPPRSGGLWPFPDLALLAFGPVPVTHPVAPLGTAVGDADGGLLTDDRVAGWGFPRREPGVDPPGSPATFVVEGVEGDGFVTLKAGQAQPGLSGAPLVCPRTRTVIGLMSATRGASSDLGGYASPASGLTDGALFASVDGRDVAEVLEQVLAANQAESLRDRSPWLAVLPVPDAERLVEQPWATFRKTARSDPADLLRADFGVVDYLFRESELQRQRREWCEAPDALGVLVVRGVGGSGKTRFGIQLCRLLQDRGWLTGWLPASGDEVLAVRVPRLLVVDYVEAADPQQLARVLMQLSATATALTPARLVLLTRTRVGGLSDPLDAMAEKANARVKQILNLGEETVGATAALVPDQRATLFQAAAAAFADAWQTPLVLPELDLSSERYQLPLEVLFEALDRTLSGQSGVEVHQVPPVERVFAHEERYWAAMMPGVDPALLRWTAAAATMAGADSDLDGHAVLAAHPALAGDDKTETREQLIRWWADLVPGPRLLNPLRPDRLGEHAAAITLDGIHELAAPVLDRVLSLPSDRQLISTLDLLARAQSSSPALADLTDDAVVRHLVALAGRATQAARPDHRGRIDRSIGEAVLRLLSADRLGRLNPHDDIPEQTRQELRAAASACTDLGTLAVEAGRAADARTLFHAALDIDQRLVAMSPNDRTHQLNLAIDQGRLADLDADSGRPDQAREGYQQSLAAFEELARLDPANPAYQQTMAIAQQRLADLERDAGHPDQAREGYQRYLAAGEELARLDPANPTYRRSVALAQQRLADLDRDAGHPDQAREGYQQSLAAFEELNRLDPANPSHQQTMAITQQRLADLDRDAGHPDQAREGYQRYLTASEELNRLDPANPSHQQNMAIAQQRLADLDRDAGHPDQAWEGYQQSLAGLEELVRLDPANTSYRQGVAIAQQRLADLERHDVGDESG